MIARGPSLGIGWPPFFIGGSENTTKYDTPSACSASTDLMCAVVIKCRVVVPLARSCMSATMAAGPFTWFFPEYELRVVCEQGAESVAVHLVAGDGVGCDEGAAGFDGVVSFRFVRLSLGARYLRKALRSGRWRGCRRGTPAGRTPAPKAADGRSRPQAKR